jgi:hypothetical protein
MKKLKISLILIFLLFFNNSSFATNWEKLLSPQDYAIYFDFKNQRIEKDLVKIWVTIDYFRAPLSMGGKNLMSVKFLDQYDCENFRVKRYYFMGFNKQMGLGDPLIVDDSISKWISVKSGTNLEGLMKSACRGEQ